MKKSSQVVGMICGALLLLAAVPAFAQEDVPTRHIEFTDCFMDGERLQPQGQLILVRRTDDFPSLVAMERTFLPAVAQAAGEKSLQ